MLACLQSSAPPLNALSKEPRIARMIGLYSQVKNLGMLPDPGGVLDMRSDHYAFFAVFASAESEYLKSLEG